jgi:DnaK suppressor protein
MRVPIVLKMPFQTSPYSEHEVSIKGWLHEGIDPQFIQKDKSPEHKRATEESVWIMTNNELNRFRTVLAARVAELERFVCHREGIAVERSAEPLEETLAASQRALAISNLDREFFQLRNARAALNRIEEGSYGMCQECDEDIHPKRLAAVPWAAFCIRCQEAADRSREEAQSTNRNFLGRAA